MSEIRVGIHGAAGRMGRENTQGVHRTPGLVLSAACERSDHPLAGADLGKELFSQTSGIIVTSDPDAFCHDCEVAVDFSLPDASLILVEAARKQGTALVIGTTGFQTAQKEAIRRASTDIPIVLSGNFSTGVNVIVELVKAAAAALGRDYDVEIIEHHHNQKVDAPSGTAVMLGQAVCRSRNIDYEKVVVTDRSRRNRRRRSEEIGISSLRGGGIIGHHSVCFMGANEKVEISHTAQSRTLFTDGVLRAVSWIAGKKSGFYTMKDVLSL